MADFETYEGDLWEPGCRIEKDQEESTAVHVHQVVIDASGENANKAKRYLNSVSNLDLHNRI